MCGLYYAFWIYVLPHFGKYKIRQELLVLDDETAKAHRLVRVPLAELATWDAEHDEVGRRVARHSPAGSHSYSGDYANNLDEKKEA